MLVCCIKPRGGITLGKTYMVVDTFEDVGRTFYEIIDDTYTKMSYYSYRFELVAKLERDLL